MQRKQKKKTIFLSMKEKQNILKILVAIKLIKFLLFIIFLALKLFVVCFRLKKNFFSKKVRPMLGNLS